ncbi:MAG: hypothetical protein ABSE99_12175 [Terracidiphilus sp.]|jgi:hypothetical protein
MKSLLCIAFLLSASLVSIAQKEPAKEYPINVHVSSSEQQGSGMQQRQVLRVVIDGKKYQLIALGSVPWALPVGDYRARITEDKPIQGGKYERRYEIIFPDGKTTQYEVGGESE